MKAPALYNGCMRKKRYKGYNQAKRVAREAMEQRPEQLYVYHCSHCQCYHLTSHPQTPGAIIVPRLKQRNKVGNFQQGKYEVTILPVDDRHNLGHLKTDEDIDFEEVQLKLVRRNDSAIKFIDNPSEIVKKEAVKHFATAIRFIDNPSEELQLMAVKKRGVLIKHFSQPSETVQLEAVKQNGDAIKFIKNPSEIVQLEAIKKNRHSFVYIDKPTENAIKYRNERYREIEESNKCE